MFPFLWVRQHTIALLWSVRFSLTYQVIYNFWYCSISSSIVLGTIDRSNRIAVHDAGWLSTAHGDALDGHGGRIPLPTSQTFNLCWGVQYETLRAFEAHNWACGKFCFAHRFQDAVGNSRGLFTKMSYTTGHGLTFWGNPLALGIAEELGVVCQAVTIWTIVECNVSK